jgi:8-oxo-dGTP pyrophosphatase MutT (NUDIX family)
MADPLEQVDIVDENDNVLYQTTKKDAHEKGLRHRCVIGLIVTDKHEHVLVRQAGHKQDANQYVSPVAGHLQAGETAETGLTREAEEEIGLKNFSYKYIGKDIFNREILGRKENHLFYFFEIYSNDTLILNDESTEYRRFSQEEIKQLRQTSPELFGDAHHLLIKIFYPELL